MSPKYDMAKLLAAARESAKEKEEFNKYLAIDLAQKGEDTTVTATVTIKPDGKQELSNIKEVKTQGRNYNKSVSSDKLAALRAKLHKSSNEEKHNPKYTPIPGSFLKELKRKHKHIVDVPALQKDIADTNAAAVGMHGEAISYNQQQQEFIDTVSSGKSCVLIGAAGTGKTTCSKGGINALIHDLGVPTLQSDGHKHLVAGSPGIIIISYTRRAVNNIRKVQSKDLKSNCITAHKLLEYAPVYYELADPETGIVKKTMRFEPMRCATNPLPNTIHTIIVEEASMLSLDLYQELKAALNHTVQWVFIGDIQQLPPVFGPAILGFKLLELPVVELTHVYRQALESPIIRLAHRILSGKPIPAEEYNNWHIENELTLHPWKKKLHPETAAATLGAFFVGAVDNGIYDPNEDMILIPYNKSCGTIELNAKIANHLARKREAVTYEIMAGFNKCYFSVGDKILYDREDAEIIEIHANPAYNGARVQPASVTLDYWGHNPNIAQEDSFASYDEEMDVDFLLEQVSSSEDRVTQASHRLVIRLLDTASEVSVSKAAEVNSLLHSYALTVHKAQGSEWRKVFLCFHQSHATMLQRELLYTAVTRAREDLYIICEPESFTKGIISQRIKGDTLAEKAEFFKGKSPKTNPKASSSSNYNPKEG